MKWFGIQFAEEFDRQAIRNAEYQEMRESYGRQPDSALDADDWTAPEEYRA